MAVRSRAGRGIRRGGGPAEAKARAGVLAVVGDTEPATQAQLTGAGAGGPSFRVSDDTQSIFADFGARLRLRIHERPTPEASFDTLLCSDQKTYQGSVQLHVVL